MRREDIVDGSAWYRSPVVGEVYEPCRLDHSIYSIRPGAAPGTVSALGLSRAKGSRTFTEDERATVEVFHGTLVPLLAARRPASADARAALTSREQDVLDGLLAGRTDKEIAADLSISRYTASQHVRSIFRKMGVSTRAELLARFLGRRTA
jgi:DNA-binding NarL/FixJ family response regulator